MYTVNESDVGRILAFHNLDLAYTQFLNWKRFLTLTFLFSTLILKMSHLPGEDHTMKSVTSVMS